MSDTKIINKTDLHQITTKINPLFEETLLKQIYNEKTLNVMKCILILFIIKIHKANKDISIEKVSDLLIDSKLITEIKQSGGVFGFGNTENKNSVNFTQLFKIIILSLSFFCLIYLDYSYIVELEKRTFTNLPTQKITNTNTTTSQNQIVPYAQTSMTTIEEIKQEIFELNKMQNNQIDNLSNIVDLIEDISREIGTNIDRFNRDAKSITQNAITGVSYLPIVSVMSKMISVDGKQYVISKMLQEKINDNIQKHGDIATIQLKAIQDNFKKEFKNIRAVIEQLNDPSFTQRFNNFIQIGLSYVTNPESIKNKISIEMDKIYNILKKLKNIKTVIGLGVEEMKGDAKLEIDQFMNELFNHINNIYYLFGTTFTIFGALMYVLTEEENVIVNKRNTQQYNSYNNKNDNYNDNYNDNDNYIRNQSNSNPYIPYKPTGAFVEDDEDKPFVPPTRSRVTRSSREPLSLTYKAGNKKSRKNKNKTIKRRRINKNKTHKK
jgi:predicted PurR-regulated permease PerM